MAALIGFEALTLAVFATLHLTGALHIGSSSKPSSGAGVAEALICVALVGGMAARSRRAALSAVAFAIFGFLVGLSFTVGGGDGIDLAYHLAMLPVLVATAMLLARSGPDRIGTLSTPHRPSFSNADDAALLERRRPGPAPARAGRADRAARPRPGLPPGGEAD